MYIIIKSRIYLLILLTALQVLSCRKIDNYPAPDKAVAGAVTDAITGKPFETEQPNGLRVVFIDKSYATPEPIRIWAREDGSFDNKTMFAGDYDVYLDEVAGVPSDRQTVTMTSVDTLRFTVTPFLSLDTVEVTKKGTSITVRYRITKNVASEAMVERDIFLNDIPRVSQKDNIKSVKKPTQTTGEFTDKIIAPGSGTFYLRLAAKTGNAYGRYNYSATIPIEVVDDGSGDNGTPGVEEGRMFESFEDASALDTWETKYNFTTEFQEPGKVKITMGSIDGYGIFAKNNATYNVSDFPILGIKVFGAPPADKWLIKLGDGSVDVVARGSQALGTKDLPDGSKIYYWDLTQISSWTGEKTTNIQIAVEGSTQPLVFGWIRTFKDVASVADEDINKEGRLFELFPDMSALDAWDTKYNFTTDFLEPGKVRITMGAIDGYGIFAKNNVNYDVDLFPILAIKVFTAPPADKWLLKMYDGAADVVARGSLAKGIKNMPDGSKVYYWDFRDISAWTGEKTTNVQLAVEGSTQPLTLGWVKTFASESAIK